MIFLLLICTQGFEIELSTEDVMCFGEELSSQTLIVGTIQTPQETEVLNVYVFDPQGEQLFSKNHTRFAKFSLAVLESGTYGICTENSGPVSIPLLVDIKSGVRAKDYSSTPSIKEMKEIDYRIKMFEDLIKQIHSRMQGLREREEQMRHTNLTIHSRVISYSICTVVLLLALAVIQIVYLKRFFKAKKMI